MQNNTPTISFGFSQHEAILFYLMVRKLLNSMPKNLDNFSFDLSIKQVTDSYQTVSQDFISNLRKTISLIASRKIIMGNKKNEDALTIMPIFSKLYISNDTLSVTFNNSCLPIIIPIINKYPADALIDILRLNSTHSIKLYQLFYGQPYLTLSLNDLRNHLGLSSCYERYYSFKHDVIVASQKEINTKTSFYLEFKEIKEARKISKIEFTFNKVDISTKKTIHL